MIAVNLPALMARDRKRISGISKETSLSRSTLTALYYGKSRNISFETLERLCAYFNCELDELLTYQPAADEEER